MSVFTIYYIPFSSLTRKFHCAFTLLLLLLININIRRASSILILGISCSIVDLQNSLFVSFLSILCFPIHYRKISLILILHQTRPLYIQERTRRISATSYFLCIKKSLHKTCLCISAILGQIEILFFIALSVIQKYYRFVLQEGERLKPCQIIFKLSYMQIYIL